MPRDRFDNKNSDYEDIFSNSSTDEFEDFYSGIKDDEYEDVSSFSDGFVPKTAPTSERVRQQIEYSDINQVYENMAPEPEKKKKKKKRHPIRNFIILLLTVALVLTGTAGYFAYSTADSLLSSINTQEPLKENEYIDESLLYSNENQTNILLVGIDAREGDTVSRSDTMMLLTLDHENGQIKLTSFLRDSYVQIAGGRKEKLNAAYARYGIQGLVDTLELNFRVSIPYYVLVDFEIFQTIVDELGGISVEVTQKESDYTYNSGKVSVPVRIEAGESVLLNGEEALWYSRIRYLDSDFMRTKRQRKVITAIIDKLKQQDINDLLELAETIAPLVTTNLPKDDIWKIGVTSLKNKAWEYQIVQQQIPAPDTWTSKSISGVGDSLVMDLEQNTEILQDFLDKKQSYEK